MKREKGITLVALVVTIVVLLILAGVSINFVFGENGLITQAQEAKRKTAEAEENEEKKIDNLTDEMDSYLKNYDLNSYNIGDKVAYTYDIVSEAYTLPSSQSGDESNQTIAQNSTTLKWKIINKDEKTGKIDIISEDVTNNTVRFKGVTGYNNGPYIMNKICEDQYSNSKLNVKARSINLLDIERHLTKKGLEKRNGYQADSNTAKYGTTKTYFTNMYYPVLYEKQKWAGMNTSVTTLPDLSRGNDPYEESKEIIDEESVTDNSYKLAPETGLVTRQTFYSTVIDEKNYGEAYAVLKNSSKYWVAARYVETFSDYVRFGLRLGDKQSITGYGMFDSKIFEHCVAFGLRPIVSLDFNMFTGEKDLNGAWTLIQ